MRKAEEIKKALAAPVPVHYHVGDPEPRLTPLAMCELEALHADALALIQQLEEKREGLMKRRYRIIRYYEDYLPQVYGEDARWHDIGYMKSYKTVEEAKRACERHKRECEKRIVEEFEL